MIPAVGGIISLIALLILLNSRKEAIKEDRAARKRLAERRRRRAQAEAKRIESGGWDNGDNFTQIRRPGHGLMEFRSIIPRCLLAGIGLVLAALDMAFLGIILPRLGLPAGILTATVGIGVFLIGRGAVIDSTRRSIRRWWGWVYKPLFWSEQDLSTFEKLEITTKLGVDRTVRYPLWLVKKNGDRILLKACGFREARDLAKEISDLVYLPMQDKTGKSWRTTSLDDGTERLLSSYQLQEKRTGFFGTWKETKIEGHRVAFKGVGGKLNIYVGEFDPNVTQLTHIYLGKVSPSQPLPRKGSRRRLDSIVGFEGIELAQNYFLNATGGEYPELQSPEVRHALLSLSLCVEEVAIFESLGIHVNLDLTHAAQSSIDSDVKQAVALFEALKYSNLHTL